MSSRTECVFYGRVLLIEGAMEVKMTGCHPGQLEYIPSPGDGGLYFYEPPFFDIYY